MRFLKAFGAGFGTFAVVMVLGILIWGGIAGYENWRFAWTRWLGYGGTLLGAVVFHRVWHD